MLAQGVTAEYRRDPERFAHKSAGTFAKSRLS